MSDSGAFWGAVSKGGLTPDSLDIAPAHRSCVYDIWWLSSIPTWSCGQFTWDSLSRGIGCSGLEGCPPEFVEGRDFQITDSSQSLHSCHWFFHTGRRNLSQCRGLFLGLGSLRRKFSAPLAQAERHPCLEPSPCTKGKFVQGGFLCNPPANIGEGPGLHLLACPQVSLSNSQFISLFFIELTCYFITSWQVSPCGSYLFGLHVRKVLRNIL